MESDINETPIPKLSAIIPNINARVAVIMVCNNDCAEITDVKISLGTWSAINPVSIGFRMFSTMKIPTNANNEIIQRSNTKEIPQIIPNANPESKVIIEIFFLFFEAIFDESIDAREVAR